MCCNHHSKEARFHFAKLRTPGQDHIDPVHEQSYYDNLQQEQQNHCFHDVQIQESIHHFVEKFTAPFIAAVIPLVPEASWEPWDYLASNQQLVSFF
jgi:hypothetical protein